MYRTQRYPINYYKLYPYNQPEDYYYPQELIYYPPARTSKYEVYQAVLPYYYQERPPLPARPTYYGYNDPVVDLQEEMIQEAEREQREDAQPIGHELLYENDDSNNQDTNMDEVNAAFLQNLIMTQMYQDALDKEKGYYDQYYDYDDGQYNSDTSDEDKDVEELKQLAKPQQPHLHQQQPKHSQDIHWFQKSSFRNQNRNAIEKKRSNDIKQGIVVYTDRKPIIKEPKITTSTIAPASSSSMEPKRLVRGQKEEVLMRPATPVRRPFSTPVLEMIQQHEQQQQSKRAPSVYDTIKQMLDMEKSLENVSIEREEKNRLPKKNVGQIVAWLLTSQDLVFGKMPILD